MNRPKLDYTYYDQGLAICCSKCRCGMNSDETFLEWVEFRECVFVHRCCCHRHFTDHGLEKCSTFQSKMQKTQIRSLTMHETGNTQNMERQMRDRQWREVTFSREDIEEKYRLAKRNEKQLDNEAADPEPSTIWNTHPSSKTFHSIFKKTSNEGVLKPATVLDLFSGIGGGIVALKKLGIEIGTIISVEHDHVAKYVFKEHHCKEGIEVVSINTFEELEDNLNLLNQHFPIDIVIGGPPCSEFSGVNANREGVDSNLGSYMPRFGKLVEKIKKHPLQKSVNLFFMCENVPLKGDDLQLTEDSLQISSILIDAKYFSPCKRNRGYFTSVPVMNIDWLSIESEASATSEELLSGGWKHPAEEFPDRNEDKRGKIILKANTFMASDTRLDDQRMMKIKQIEGSNKYHLQYYTINEREAMMGFPVGYVEKPVKKLFDKLCTAYHECNWAEHDDCRDSLDFLIENFSGHLDIVKFSDFLEAPYFCELLVGTADRNRANKRKYYLNKEKYAKRLIGNSFSIPVVMKLLEPLVDIFPHKEYEGYSYVFPWKPHNLR